MMTWVKSWLPTARTTPGLLGDWVSSATWLDLTTVRTSLR